MGAFATIVSSPEKPAASLVSSARNRWWRDLALLALLVVVTSGLRFWQINHTEVAARDSIGFIREAWRLRVEPWGEVVRTSEQHPGYPLVLLAVSWPVREFVSGSDASTMQLSAQLASALASVLLILPMYFLGKALFNRRVGFWAAVLFQCLPTSSRILADGISEATFLLFAGTSLWLAVLALRGQSKLLFGVAGLTSGLAYLTRPEGAVVVAATAAVLAGMQVKQSFRRPWVQFIGCGCALIFGWGLVGAPFMAATGHFTIKNTAVQIAQPQLTSPAPMPLAQKENQAQTPTAAELPARPEKSEKIVSWGRRVWETQMVWGLRTLGSELQKGFFYVTWVPTLLGLWWYRRRCVRMPGQWVLLLVSVAMLLVLYRVASYMRYLSDRHTVLLIYCCCFWSAAGALAIGRKLAVLARRWPQRQNQYAAIGFCLRLVHDPRLWSGLGFVALTALAVVKDVEPLHANRKGFRDAGTWIAEHAAASDELIDPYSWTHYYAGRLFLDEHSPSLDPARTCYIVVDESGNEHPRLRIDPEIMKRARQGQIAFESKRTRKKDCCHVCVYAVPLTP